MQNITPSPTPLIICLGAGLEHRDPFSPPRNWIGLQTRLRAEAAVMLWKKHPESSIIFSGGRSAPTGPSEAEVMKDFVTQSPWNIPASVIRTENESGDTSENVRRVVELLRAEGVSTGAVLLIAGRRHMRRAVRYFAAYGVRVQPILASDALGIPVENIATKDRLKEIILTLLQCVDRRGRIPTWMKHRQ